MNDIKIDQIEGERFADKTTSIKNDYITSDACQKELYREFVINQNLLHPHILKHHYFVI